MSRISLFSLAPVAVAASLVLAVPSAQADPWKKFPIIKTPILMPLHPKAPHHGHWGPGVGIGLGLLGATVAAAAYAGDGSCRTVRRYDEDGEYVGRVRVCE